MRHFLVDVKNIRPGRPGTDFDRATVDRLADAILASGGLLKPLVLHLSGPGGYVVADRHLEYWAAVRAREKDPRAGEMVNAYVVPPESVGAVEAQLEVLRAAEAAGKSAGAPASPAQAGRAVPEPLSPSRIAECVGAAISGELDAVARRLDSLATLGQIEDALDRRLSALAAAAEKPKKPAAKRSTVKKPAEKKPEFNPNGPYDEENLDRATIDVLKQFMRDRGILLRGLRLKPDFIEAIIKFYE